MRTQNIAFKPAGQREWTAERIERLETPDVLQLRENAEKLGASAVVALCDVALNARPKSTKRRGGASTLPKRAANLVSRRKAFQVRGVFVADGESGWSGVRKEDGTVVMTLWARGVLSRDEGCSQLLWGPNIDGSRPWSDTPAGQERLKHCKLALERGGGEGMLVYGENFDGEVAEHNARSIYGADPVRWVHFRVEQRGTEYWAVWGAKASERAL